MDTDSTLGIGIIVFISVFIIIGIGSIIYNAWKYNNNRNYIDYNII
jgi:hypothetical protein